MPNELADIWRRIIVGDTKSWVLFENGTCVILMEPGKDLAAQATEIIQKWGPVHVGSPVGDFSVITLEDAPGWVVTGHHPDMLTYVASEEVGLEPHIIHVEDRRKRTHEQ